MTGPDDARSTEDIPATDQWRRVTRYYRRPLGLGWLIGLVAIPLLLGAIGYGLQDRPVSGAAGPTGTLTRPAPAPPQSTTARVPPIAFAPASVVRAGNSIVLGGEFPDQKAKAALVDAVAGALPAGVSLVDRLGVNPSVNALDFTDAEKVFTAAAPLSDFKLSVQGETVTLAGTAATADQRDAVEQAARDTWPNLHISDSLAVRGGQGGDCANLKQAIADTLPQPITFGLNAATLNADAERELTGLADKLKSCPSGKIVVNGFSDNTGGDGVNLPLSTARAEAVADFLAAKGVAREQVTLRGMGSADPVAGNDTPDGRAQNRRAEIAVS